MGRVDEWRDERIWRENAARPVNGTVRLTKGRIIEKSVEHVG